MKLLKRQAADVDTMLSAMGQQLSQLIAAYREELENVERALLQVCSRQEVLQSPARLQQAMLSTIGARTS